MRLDDISGHPLHVQVARSRDPLGGWVVICWNGADISRRGVVRIGYHAAATMIMEGARFLDAELRTYAFQFALEGPRPR